MSNFLEAYAAVHNNEVKENFYSKRDELSSIEFGILSDDQLQDISEGILLNLLESGFSISGVDAIFNEVIREAKTHFVGESMTPRHVKVQRIKKAFGEALSVAKQKARVGVKETFQQYRNLKEQRKHMTQFQGSAFGVESKNRSAQYQIESKNAIALLTSSLREMVERATETLVENDKKRKSVYESKKADKDYDGDGEVESGTDEWKGSRNNAIKKAIKNAMMDKGNPAKEEEKLRKSNKLFGAPMKEEKKQGYNDRLDDSLGSKHGKKSQSMKDRRDESEAMEKKEGKRKYSSDKQMDKDDDVCESTLSAKAGRAGKDLGKPGKNFQKIAAKAGKRYGSSEAGERVAGAILAKMRKANEEFDFDNTYGFLMSRGLTEEQTLWAIANYPELL